MGHYIFHKINKDLKIRVSYGRFDHSFIGATTTSLFVNCIVIFIIYLFLYFSFHHPLFFSCVFHLENLGDLSSFIPVQLSFDQPRVGFYRHPPSWASKKIKTFIAPKWLISGTYPSTIFLFTSFFRFFWGFSGVLEMIFMGNFD